MRSAPGAVMGLQATAKQRRIAQSRARFCRVEANHCGKQVRHKNGFRNSCARYPEGERNFDRRRPRFHFRGERTLK
jgi:hypothetical protein